MADESREPDFKIQDHRSSTGDTASKENTSSKPPETESPRPEPPAEESSQLPPESTFASLTLSLGTQAMISLGQVKDPQGKDAQPDLPTARYLIDTLDMLKKKTHGNLDQEEARLLESLLYQLRMQYVESDKKQPPSSEQHSAQ